MTLLPQARFTGTVGRGTIMLNGRPFGKDAAIRALMLLWTLDGHHVARTTEGHYVIRWRTR